MKNIFFFYTLILFFLNGCSTRGAVSINDQNLPLQYLKSMVSQTLPGGPKKVSVNGREYFSHPFIYVRGKLRQVDNVSKRYHAKITILGDRRPYDIEVLVIGQTRKGDKYVDQGPNKTVAEQIANMIHKTLTKRPGDGNVVDDFRVF